MGSPGLVLSRNPHPRWGHWILDCGVNPQPNDFAALTAAATEPYYHHVSYTKIYGIVASANRGHEVVMHIARKQHILGKLAAAAGWDTAKANGGFAGNVPNSFMENAQIRAAAGTAKAVKTVQPKKPYLQPTGSVYTDDKIRRAGS